MVSWRASITVLFFLTSAIACKQSPSQEEPPTTLSSPEPSSVFLITVDTLRADRLGVYGNDVIKTPHLDRLANRGTVFLEAFAQSSTT
ncbi:MAG: sulfatase-like hydrolase/transferase, partial [Myxococcota bacterium]|nr:sulfatase-like hydrolase/transferase [Myxococcota bacterium]